MDNKIKALMEIMFEEDEYRYNNNIELMYHTKEEFKEELKEKEEKNKKRLDKKQAG